MLANVLMVPPVLVVQVMANIYTEHNVHYHLCEVDASLMEGREHTMGD